MPNSIDFYKGIFLHVIPARIIVPYFQQGCRSRVYPNTLIKKELHHKDIWEISLSKFFQQSCRPTSCRLQLYQKWHISKKQKELTFNSKGGLYCVKDNLYNRMMMPMLMPMATCWCRDFQMVENLILVFGF